MRFSMLLVLLLALSALGCGYTWRPLHEAKLERYPHVGSLVLHTKRGSLDMVDAKVAPDRGIHGKWVAPGGRQAPIAVPASEILGGAVYEPVVTEKQKRLAIGLGVGLGLTAGVLVTLGALLAHVPSFDFRSF